MMSRDPAMMTATKTRNMGDSKWKNDAHEKEENIQRVLQWQNIPEDSTKFTILLSVNVLPFNKYSNRGLELHQSFLEHVLLDNFRFE